MGRKIRSTERTGEIRVGLDKSDPQKRLAAERRRAQEIGFLELAKEVAKENADTLSLLAKH